MTEKQELSIKQAIDNLEHIDQILMYKYTYSEPISQEDIIVLGQLNYEVLELLNKIAKDRQDS